MPQEQVLRSVIKEPLAPVPTGQGTEYRFIHTRCRGDRVLSGAQVQVHLSEVCDTAVCALCQQPIHPVPYVFHETVQFRPHFGQAYIECGRKYALVLGVQWFGQWVIDVQHLRQHEYDPEFLELTPVKEYMVPAYAVERAPFQWFPTTKRGGDRAQATGVKGNPTRGGGDLLPERA